MYPPASLSKMTSSNANQGTKVLVALAIGVFIGCLMATTCFATFLAGAQRPGTISAREPEKHVPQPSVVRLPLNNMPAIAITHPTKPSVPVQSEKLVEKKLDSFSLPIQTNIQCAGNVLERINITKQEEYCQGYQGVVKTWLLKVNVAVVTALMRAQTRACMFGSIGEIGVCQGGFFIAMTLSALPLERRIAMDYFWESGLLPNAQRFGLQQQDFEMIMGNSHNLTARSFRSRSIPAFRVFSVDGGHDYETTLHDLTVASKVIMPGGVIILDDYMREAYPGIPTALADFLADNPRIAPFLFIGSKLYLTTADYYQTWFDWADRLPYGKCSTRTKTEEWYKRDPILRGWTVCIRFHEASFETAAVSHVVDAYIANKTQQ